MSCAAIIVASGTSRRMGFDKLAADLGGRPVLRVALDAFLATPAIGRAVLACPPERFETLLGGDFAKPVTRVDGGRERQDSVRAGLDVLGPDDAYVAVHDGARPLVTPEAITACLEAAETHGAATLARAISETIKRDDGHGFSAGGVDRDGLWHTETPQIFRTDLLRRAYDEVARRGLTVTDEVSALEAISVATRFVPSPAPNFKITRPADLDLARAVLA